MKKLSTIGFTKKDLKTFVGLLRAADVSLVVDVRLRNTSQLAGFAKRDDLAFVLDLCGIAYAHAPELAPTDEMLDEYKRSKDWNGFAGAFDRILRQGDPGGHLADIAEGHVSVCLLCTEHAPAYCHRRILAEYIHERRPGIEVVHLL